MRLTRKVLTKVSVIAGTLGVLDAVAAGTWVTAWSADAHSAIRGGIWCMIGLATAVAAVVVLAICHQTQAIIETTAVSNILGEAARVQDATHPHLRLCTTPTLERSRHAAHNT